MKTALTIAGSDSSGGAGIQADIKTMTANGVYAMSAITALTAQNTTGVYGILEVTPEFLANQLDCIFTDIRPDAVKTGMVSSSALIEVIAQKLTQYKAKNLVIDPVMVATSGAKLIADDAVEALTSELIPLADIITPNIPEAEILLGGERVSLQKDLPDAARKLADMYGASVLLKAGHLKEEALVDIFHDVEDGKTYELPSVRIHTANTHGTGCTLSSAFASMLAKGMSLPEAAAAAKDYINGAIIAGAEYKIGHGFGPVDHFYKFR